MNKPKTVFSVHSEQSPPRYYSFEDCLREIESSDYPGGKVVIWKMVPVCVVRRVVTTSFVQHFKEDE